MSQFPPPPPLPPSSSSSSSPQAESFPQRPPPPHPYPPPLQPLNYAPPARNDLREIAKRQRAIMICILIYLGAGIGQFILPPEVRPIVALAIFGVVITATVFVFMLAIALYNTGVGVLLGILTLIPLVGLIVLLIVNGKATNVLRAHGVRVGLLGARLDQIPETVATHR